MAGYTAHIALLMLDLHIPEARSLKDKRSVLKSIKDKLSNNFNISISEIGEQDKWQRAVLGVTMIANDKKYVESTLSKIRDKADLHPRASIIDSNLEWL